MKYKRYPSQYELQYIKWNGIDFDKEKLTKFMKRLKITRYLSFIPSYNEEHDILCDILHSYDIKSSDNNLTVLNIINGIHRIHIFSKEISF